MKHMTTRVRHETRQRTLTISRIERLNPRMLRFAFTSPDLGDFVSAAHDDHVKLVFPHPPGTDENAKPLRRDFTPRAYDAAAGTMVIDFALHESGPATQWATAARVGETLDIRGPRGSKVVPDDFDWYLLIGDETALPAIGRRVEELRAGVPVTTLATIADAGEAQSFDTRAAWTPLWATRPAGSNDDAALLQSALAGWTPPPGDGFVWIAGEAALARALRDHFIDERGHPKDWVKAAGYWQRGDAGGHVHIRD
ncbi:MAG TPA: siderophore-interacting protein [Alphaproteobacteria bacterium]